jgi:hypothetical protein
MTRLWWLLVLAAPLVAQPAAIGSNDPKNSFNIIILAEGWRAGEETAFRDAASRMSSELLDNVEPYKQFKSFIRIVPMFVASDSHGCQQKLARPSQPLPNELDDNGKSTYFGIVFKSRYEIEGGQIKKVIPLPDVTPHKPPDIEARIKRAVGDEPYSMIFMLSPDEDRSPGLKFDEKLVFQSTYDLKEFPQDIAKCMAHELGHGMFNLADEYSAGGTCAAPTSEPMEANVTIESDPQRVKWAYLGIGLEPGGKYCRERYFHPTRECRMLNPREVTHFCKVCLERVTHAMSERVKLIVSVDPGRMPKIRLPGSPMTFSVKTRCVEPDPAKPRYSWMWLLDGVDMGPGTRTVAADGCTYSCTVNPGSLSFGSHELRFLVADTLNLSTGEASPKTHRTPHSQKWFIWSPLLKSPLPRLSTLKSWR